MLVGLTGGIGSGKSEVARRLAELGAYVIDMDALARAALAPGAAGELAVGAAFGERVLAGGGGLDRARLADLVFTDPAARARLEAIVHPLVRSRAAELTAAAPAGAIVVHEVPLLVESGLAGGYDVVVVVIADEQTRLRRLIARGLTEAQARARIAAQCSDADRRAVADLVLPNAAPIEALPESVAKLWSALQTWHTRTRVDRTFG